MASFTSLIPLLLLLAFVAGFAWVGYQMYLYTNALAERGQAHMAKRNINFSKDKGMTVGVKHLSAEEYSSRTQNVLVNTWNSASFPAFKSRFWNQDAPINSRQHSATASSSSSSKLAPPDQRPEYARSASSTMSKIH